MQKLRARNNSPVTKKHRAAGTQVPTMQGKTGQYNKSQSFFKTSIIIPTLYKMKQDHKPESTRSEIQTQI